MHFYCLIRGHKPELDNWIDDLLSVTLKYKGGINQNGKNIDAITQLGIRPVQLYEFTFPEEELQKVLGILNPGREMWIGRFTKYIKWFRKFMRLKKIPEFEPNPFESGQYINITGIGLRKDVRNADGIEQI